MLFGVVVNSLDPISALNGDFPTKERLLLFRKIMDIAISEMKMRYANVIMIFLEFAIEIFYRCRLNANLKLINNELKMHLISNFFTLSIAV